jgi:hypothetical protein
MVTVHLGAGQAQLAWPKTPLQALTNLAELWHASAFCGVDRERILHDDSAPTALERADDNWGPVARWLGGLDEGAAATVTTLAANFDRHLAPAIRQPRTQANYWSAWRLVVTWAVARNTVRDILPMSFTTLKALTWDLACLAVPTSQVELVWKTMQARHRQYHWSPPMTRAEANQFSSRSKMLCSIQGRPMALKLLIQQATVSWLFAWLPLKLAAHRVRLLTVVATLGCIRINAAASLRSVVRLHQGLTSYGIPGWGDVLGTHQPAGK